MSTINELKWASLTAAINEMKSPNQFLRRRFFSNHVTVPTEDIEISVITKGREVAPFVRKNGEAVNVSGHASKFQTVSPTNIRLKRAFTPSELLFGRQPGTVIFSPGAAYQMSAVQQHINRDLQVMSDMIVNAEEYLCALALRGTISYSQTDQEVFTITFPRPAGHNVTLTTFWDDADPTLPRPVTDILTAKRLIADEHGLGVTDAIVGSEASAALLELAESGNIKLLDIRNAFAGSVTFNEQFTEDGVIFLGNIGGVNFWEYSRTADVNGVATDMVRPKYVEFIAGSPAAERVLYYGAIPDIDAFEGLRFQGERFSKSWRHPDPSAQMALVHTRPLPVPRRPGATVSMKVVSG